MVPKGASYSSETAWQYGTGGVSATFTSPLWQQGVNVSAVGGSTAMRNFPDVAMVADNVWINYDHTTAYLDGTSCGAPLWAGIAALANEYCAALSKPQLGFLNPAIYAIGASANYGASFNDIKTGNNTWSNSPNQYYAATGYDLCTGWGTPKTDLIGYLSAYAGNANVVFVDFKYTGSTQNGQYATPFKTMSQGVNAVAVGGTVIVNGGGSNNLSSNTVAKRLTITAINGTATVGR